MDSKKLRVSFCWATVFIAVFIFGIVASPYINRLFSDGRELESPFQTTHNVDHQAHNLPSDSVIIKRNGYSLSYDLRTRNARWVHERLSLESLTGNKSRTRLFKEDLKIPKPFRATHLTYSNSGFDRGHMACAANHKASKEGMMDTFILSNTCPQEPKFNRGCWAKLERHVRELTKECDLVEVFTGALYLPKGEADGTRWVKYRVIGENDVAVPTHFYKVIFLRSGADTKHEAYIIPNDSQVSGKPLEQFKTTAAYVEKVSGVIFNYE